ncbi:MAG: CbtA family protein [Alphaproteobacteria bacterium]
MFQRIALSALAAGIVGGLLITLVQGLAVTPLIFEAETYEVAGDAGHDQTDEAWVPADGLERTFWTGGANVVSGVGFALLLGAGFALSGRAIDWKRGLLWGAAGFAAFAALPALGLPPELPGTEAAPLIERQIWWLATAASSVGGLALLAFASRLPWKGAGIVLLFVPHLIGAPQPEHHGGLAPAELERAFITASLAANALFWLVLGALTGLAFDRLGRARPT